MKQHVKSLGWTLVTAGLFFVLLLGIQFFFKNFYVADRFQEQLAQIDGVEKVEVIDNTITLNLGLVPNIKETYEKITGIIDEKDYNIVINDLPSEKLQETAEISEIAIQEGIFRGNFTEMSDYIRNFSETQGIKGKLFVGSKKVFLQLEEKNYYLYRIFDRPEAKNLDTAG
ncbi:MAG: hypothetical protein ACOX4H_00815 [Bacillota bacterium]|jgi:hypothetical protein|nr:hypothetical protein [Clostridia bacterium]